MEIIEALGDNKLDGEPLVKKRKVDPDLNTKEIFDSFKYLDVYFLSKQPQSRYRGYKLYFDEGIDLDKELIKKVKASMKFMVKNSDIYTKDSATETDFLSVSVRRFYDDEVFMSKWKTFKEDLKNFPEDTLNCLGLAVYQCLAYEKFKDGAINSVYLPKLRVKIFDYEFSEPIDDLQDFCGKLLEIRGRVVKIKRPTYQIEWLLFSCTRCFWLEAVKQINKSYTPPKICKNCGKRKFKAQKDSLFTKSVAMQDIKLQCSTSMEDEYDQKVMNMLDVKLLGDLVSICSLDDDVKVVGVLKSCLRKGKEEILSTELFYLEAVSLIKVPKAETPVTIELDEGDNDIIEKIRAEPGIFSSILRSFCPEINGHNMVKAGLLLSLFGSSESEEIKGNINVMLFGDSGVGKSVLAKACAQAAPKSVYVKMNRNTLLGFNVKSAKKKEKKPIFESGALVRANGGSCVIDEFRKLSVKQFQDLFEVMEDQNLCVQKLEVNRTIPVKTSIILAARPIGGKFDYKKTFEKNLAFDKDILKRFDLVFFMLDYSELSFDALKATQVLKSQRSKSINDYDEISPEERVEDLISQISLRKYILYARKIKARLSEASAKIIDCYFVELKKKYYFNELLCHNRHFESLIRLTQARAKSELREETTEYDAAEVVAIHKFAIETLKKVILSSRSQGRYKKAASEDIRLYFKKVIKSDDSLKEQ